MSGKRSAMEISADILKVTLNGAKKSHIIYKANINFQLGKKYLNHLTNSGLIIDSVNGNRLYLTTDKGMEYIKQFEDLKKLANWGA